MGLGCQPIYCPRCHGELYLDRRSVADAAAQGYLGGRIACQLGCTERWSLQRIDAGMPVSSDEGIKHILCIDCSGDIRTRNLGTKRCERCRRAKALAVSRAQWKRYQAKHKGAA